MAQISVKVRCPKVPNFLTVEMPGKSRGVATPLSQFTIEDLEGIAKDWETALIARRAEMIRSGGAEPEETEDDD